MSALLQNNQTNMKGSPNYQSSTATPAIYTEKLTKNYGSNRGILDLDLEIHPGEVFGFLGPNGAGKTTTIRLLLNLLTPTSGKASIYGLDAQKDSVAIKKFIGYLPGEFMLYPQLTGAQLLKYFANLRGGIPWQRISSLAERLELDMTKKFRDYSHGNKQKVGIIQAVMHQPRLLILDEPTNGLDPLNQQEFYKIVREARDQGSTVFLSSHIMAEVEATCDRVALVREGRLIKVGLIDELVGIQSHYLEMEFAGLVELEAFAQLPGVSQLHKEQLDGETKITCIVPPDGLDAVIKTAGHYSVLHFISREPSLEEIFLNFYRIPGENGQNGR
jgi:ABC-2 type transport system ATP-binding protein